jgi:hypothetical protein
MATKNGFPLQEVAERLDRAGVPWAVFAGAAASAYGAARPLTDVDILVPAAHGEQVAALFPEGQVKHWGALLGIELPQVDILAGLAGLDLDEPMAARLRRHEVAGVSAPVIPPEDNILLKGMWGRGPEQGKHDWEDVEAMLSHLPALDWAYLRWRAESFGQKTEAVLTRLEALWHQLGKEEPSL